MAHDARDPAGHPAGSGARVLIYSHDTFGLGHLRRSRAIANALVAAAPGTSILIISGSPVIGNFEFGPGVDYVRVPGVTKQADGDYTSLNLSIDIDEATALRAAIIRETAASFQPDLFIVDKEPAGFRGEMVPALEYLSGRGCRIVLGVRDVMDEPALLVPEWERKGALAVFERYYDEAWVYGLENIHAPLSGLPLSSDARKRLIYTGYLKRELPPHRGSAPAPRLTRDPFLLVTPGGGGDGEDLVDWVICAYETDETLPLPALICFGPFINRDRRRSFLARIARQRKLEAITFDTRIEFLMKKAEGIVAMGGYNTFCEILSFDKKALIVPRTRPRLEQAIRAEAAERLGLAARLIDPGEGRDPRTMAQALHTLPLQNEPSKEPIPGLLDGLDAVCQRFRAILAERGGRHLDAAAE